MTVAGCKPWTLAFPPIPDSVPETVGFWGPGGEYRNYDSRVAWLDANLPGDRVQRLFAAACASRCLPAWEEKYPDDLRPRETIETAEWLADLKRPTAKDREKLARAASWAAVAAGAAWAAARAAWAAARAARASEAAARAAEAAAWAAEAAEAAGAAMAAWAAGAAARASEAAADRLAQSRILTLTLPLSGWDQRWESDAARGIASSMYDDRAWDRTPILADALQDEGCEHWILDTLRDPRFPDMAFRGLWIVDRLGGKR